MIPEFTDAHDGRGDVPTVTVEAGRAPVHVMHRHQDAWEYETIHPHRERTFFVGKMLEIHLKLEG